MAGIRLDDVSKVFGGHTALEHIVEGLPDLTHPAGCDVSDEPVSVREHEPRP